MTNCSFNFFSNKLTRVYT